MTLLNYKRQLTNHNETNSQLLLICHRIHKCLNALLPPTLYCITLTVVALNGDKHYKGRFTHSMQFPCRAHAVPLPCRRKTAVLCCGLEKNGMVGAWHGHGMASVNQTRPHYVNQMGKTHYKLLAARHGRGTAWERHAMCESSLSVQ